MTEIERMHEERINALDRRVDVLSQKVDDYIAESRAARAKTDEELKEMRANMNAFNQRMDAMNQRMDAMNQRMDAMNQRIDNAITNFKNLTTTAMFGIAGMSIAVIIAVAIK